MAWGRGQWIPKWPPGAAWTIVFFFFVEVQFRKWTVLHLRHRTMAQNQGDCVARQCVLGLCWGASSRLLHTTLLTLRGNDTSSPICCSPVWQLSPPLSLQFYFSPLLAHRSISPSLPPPHLSYLFVIIALQTYMSHSIFFCPNRFPYKYSWQRVIGLGFGFRFLTSYKCWTIAETHLGYPAVAQNQGDFAARQPSKGRFCESFRLLRFSPLSTLDSLRLTGHNLCSCRLHAALLPMLSVSQQGKQLKLQSQGLHAGGCRWA